MWVWVWPPPTASPEPSTAPQGPASEELHNCLLLPFNWLGCWVRWGLHGVEAGQREHSGLEEYRVDDRGGEAVLCCAGLQVSLMMTD